MTLSFMLDPVLEMDRTPIGHCYNGCGVVIVLNLLSPQER